MVTNESQRIPIVQLFTPIHHRISKKGITMSNFEIENTVKSSDTVDNHARLGQSIHGQLSTEDFKNLLPKRVQPDVCIRDEDGYIACGPIVGIERPEPPIFKPRFDKPSFDKPSDIEKFPINRLDQVSPNQLLGQKDSLDKYLSQKKN
mgnify:CR=1 FL=1